MGESMQSILENDEKPTTSAPAAAKTPIWVIALVGILAVLLAWVGLSAHATRKKLTAELKDANDKLAKLSARAASIEDNYAELEGQSKLAFERLGLTQQELAQARSLALQIRREQQEQLGVISGEMQEVKGEVAGHREAIDEARTRLQKAIGDLGEQSGLIARNRQELDSLKLLGEREYFDFEIAKSRDFNRVGPIAIRLKSTDTKRKKYTVTLLADDVEIEKKDKTLLEPVQFYLRGSRRLREIVVYEIEKNSISGYLSLPRVEEPKADKPKAEIPKAEPAKPQAEAPKAEMAKPDSAGAEPQS
jgi:cell division protein FtsB